MRKAWVPWLTPAYPYVSQRTCRWARFPPALGPINQREQKPAVQASTLLFKHPRQQEFRIIVKDRALLLPSGPALSLSIEPNERWL